MYLQTAMAQCEGLPQSKVNLLQHSLLHSLTAERNLVVPAIATKDCKLLMGRVQTVKWKKGQASCFRLTKFTQKVEKSVQEDIKTNNKQQRV